MSRTFFWMALFVFLFLMGLGVRKDALADQKIVIGWLEEVYLPEYNFIMKAKMDTGAKNSSIHAMDIEYVKKEKGDGSRIRFRTMDLKGRSRVIEADLVREVHIKKSSFITRTRPEIELEICVGGIRKRIRVNLADRGGMNYRVILGRTALEGDFIVDISKKYVGGPRCPKP